MKKVFGIVAILAAVLALGFTAQQVQAQVTVHGVVSDADGAPVAGALVAITGMGHERGQRPFMGRAQTGDDGAYSFANVPDGRYLVTAMTRALGGARGQADVAGADVELNLTVQGRGGNGGGGNGGGNGGGEVVVGGMTGHVIDVDGAAVAEARVVVSPVRLANRRGHMRMPRLNTQTDADGNYAFAELPVGNWVVMVMKRGVGAGRARVEVAVGDPVQVEDITLRNHR